RGYGNGSYRPYSADANVGGFNRSLEGTQRSNPLGKDGKVMRCFKCGSLRHFSRYCSQSRDDRDSQEIHITLINAEPEMTTLVRRVLEWLFWTARVLELLLEKLGSMFIWIF
ncbi:unnamed protein product, partial [Meganyctiphanes norvegica]